MGRNHVFELFILGILIILLGACSTGNPLPGEGVDVKMGRATWDTGWFQAEVYKLLLEELGYTVRAPETLENVAFYIFASQGDVDFWANGWFPIHNRFLEYDRTVGKVEPVGFEVKTGALQGYLIGKNTAKTHNITSLNDLQDPAIAKLFDIDGDGKADLIGCNEGWGCAPVIDHHILELGLSETVTHLQGDYSILALDVITRYNEGEPILFYAWTPHWTSAEFTIGEDVVWLNVPLSSEDNQDLTQYDIAGCLVTPCNLGFEISDIRVVASVAFLEANPAAAGLFEVVQIPLGDISRQNALMHAEENTEEDIQRHAAEWIEENRELVESWLDIARNAGMSDK